MSKRLVVSEGENWEPEPYGSFLDITCLISESHKEVESQLEPISRVNPTLDTLMEVITTKDTLGTPHTVTAGQRGVLRGERRKAPPSH